MSKSKFSSPYWVLDSSFSDDGEVRVIHSIFFYVVWVSPDFWKLPKQRPSKIRSSRSFFSTVYACFEEMATVYSKYFKSSTSRFHMISTKRRFKVGLSVPVDRTRAPRLLSEIFAILHEKEVSPSPLKNCLPFQIVTVCLNEQRRSSDWFRSSSVSL